jgi:MFS family permease
LAGHCAETLIEGVADAAASVIQIGSGYIADRSGKQKGLALGGYGIANVMRPLLSLATAWWQILFIRFGDRVGKGVRGAPRNALLADAIPPNLRGTAYGVHRGMDHVGAFLGPIIAYFMLSHGVSVRAVFAWTAVSGAVCIVVLALFVSDVTRQPSMEPPDFGLAPSPAYRRFLIAVLVFSLAGSSDAFLLWRAKELGIAVSLAPILWTVLHVVKSASAFSGGALSDWLGRRATILAGWIFYAFVYLSFGFASRVWEIWTLFALYGVFYGLSESPAPALVVDLVAPEWRGRELGTYNAVIGLATLPASVIFGALYQALGARVVFSVGASLAFVASFLLPASDAASK